MKEVFVVSGDWKFRALVRAELRERGYEARGYEGLATAAGDLSPEGGFPALLVLDAADAEAASACEQVASWAKRFPVVVVVGAGEATFQPPPGVSVLHRPMRIEEIVARVVERAGPPG